MDNKLSPIKEMPIDGATLTLALPEWVAAWRQQMQREGIDFIEPEEWAVDRSDDGERDVDLW